MRKVQEFRRAFVEAASIYSDLERRLKTGAFLPWLAEVLRSGRSVGAQLETDLAGSIRRRVGV
jgi:hypothetical protein